MDKYLQARLVKSKRTGFSKQIDGTFMLPSTSLMLIRIQVRTLGYYPQLGGPFFRVARIKMIAWRAREMDSQPEAGTNPSVLLRTWMRESHAVAQTRRYVFHSPV